ncbi:unnamed protein product [Paramecium pentaurelia]|uniref:Uncharacterized protein n=1 Tax=Paramecium pentaurelia TaxID=43138 RepID=A0A8S1US58_9CILI|nr:unnamed protein product [Paramecium pentaurelia]
MNELWYDQLKTVIQNQNQSERDSVIKKQRQDIIQLPYLRHPKQLRVNSITNLKNISSDRFKQYLQQIQLKRLAKRDQYKNNNSETEIYPFLNLQAKQIKFSEKEFKANNLSVSISQSNILNSVQNLQTNKISFARLNLQQNSLPQAITNIKDSSRRIKTFNQIDTAEIIEQPDNKQQLYLKLRFRNSLIKQTINNWIKQRYNFNRKFNS